MDVILAFWADVLAQHEDAIDIKLPEITTFSDLESVVKDLKLVFENSLNLLRIENNLRIITAEPGSIWLQVFLGAPAALLFVGQLCKLAAGMRVDFAKARQWEEYSRSMGIQNEMLQQMTVTIQKTNDLKLEALAKELQGGNAKEASREVTNHLKLALKMTAELMDKGAKFLPESMNPEIQNAFPDQKGLDFISSVAKQIENSDS